jgi:NADP-dependent 3-hydroxy acid dehydrogenase YdfG
VNAASRPQALVTGASRGVGAAVAVALAATYDVLIGGRDAGALHQLAAQLPRSRPWPVDLTSTDALAVGTRGIERLDVLVHSAGVCELGPVAQTPAALWRLHYEINVVAVAELTRLLLPALRAAHGHVVLINSGQGQRPSPGWGAYAASKFALRAFGEVLRAEEPGVTSVYPGRIATEMQRRVRAVEGAPYEPERYLQPESVAGAVLFAVTAPRDAHLTEIVLRPDGQ